MQLNINKNLSLTSKCKALHFDIQQTEGQGEDGSDDHNATGYINMMGVAFVHTLINDGSHQKRNDHFHDDFAEGKDRSQNG